MRRDPVRPLASWAASVLVVILSAALVAGCTSPADQVSRPDDATDGSDEVSDAAVRGTQGAAGAVLDRELMAPDGRTRSYRLVVPTGIEVDAGASLVIALHGGGGSGSQFQAAAGLDALAAEAGVVVAYPDGWGRGPENDRTRTWNGGICCGPAAREDVDDVGFIDALVDDIAAEHPVDADRVVIVGHSNGAVMAYRLACELSEHVVAIGVQAGPLGVDGCEPSRPVSVVHVHGEQDENVPLDGGVGREGLSGTDWPPVVDGLERLASAAGCGARTGVSQGAVATITRWTGCEARVVELVVVAGAGHAWIGSARDDSGVPFSSTAAIWESVVVPR